MESLICNEVWLMSPIALDPRSAKNGVTNHSSFYTTEEDCEHAFRIYMQKEVTYMPENKFLDHIKSNDFINIARSKAVQWLIQSRKRLNLSFGTVFNAANYMDRFISMKQCHGWKEWMVELLSVVCLSIASKFGETTLPPLDEIQMEGLDHSFQSNLIQQMELTVLKTLEWRLNCTSAYSYVELMTWNIDFHSKPLLLDELTARLTELLLGALIDCKFYAFRPCVIAVSVLRCVLEELLPSTCKAHLSHFTSLIPQDLMDDLAKCHKMMEERLVDQVYNLVASGYSYYNPSSPITVLTMEHKVHMYDSQVDLSFFKIPGLIINLKSSKKRKREVH